MEYLVIIVGLVIGVVVWSVLSEKKQKAKLRQRILNEWGQIPQEEYTFEKFESIKDFSYSRQDNRYDVDDITWNDLDMDEIYMLINNTQSSLGEEYLFSLLKKPSFSHEELKERDRLINFFLENEDKRVTLQLLLKRLGKLTHISVYKYINLLDNFKVESNIPHYVMALGLIISFGLLFINPPLGGFLTLAFLSNNIYQYYKKKALIENYLTVFAYIIRLLQSANDIEKLGFSEIKTYTDSLKKDRNAFKSFKNGSIILTSQNPSGNLLDAIIDYGRMLFHIDLMKFNSMLTVLKNNREALNRLFTNIGFLDSMIAIASFRKYLDYYCQPELIKSSEPMISVEDLYHPLLNNPIPNSISQDSSALITGSNASGKSTFIKNLAINAILAQTTYTSISKKYKASCFAIFTSMALRDNILSNESYYIVEIKSLKRILDHVNDEVPLLCFVDEVLRGTNTLERIGASSRILSSLANKNTLVFAATHDIELTHILENSYSNYHFQEHISDNKILFDYKLHSGRAISRNAIKLLELLGYSNDIIEDAEEAVDEFLQKGEWKVIHN
ncbi:MAG: hypothetical protein GX915_00120 [Clostridiales bacterium]|nr:hypothetical protein [Clostridiales bacterium]